MTIYYKQTFEDCNCKRYDTCDHPNRKEKVMVSLTYDQAKNEIQKGVNIYKKGTSFFDPEYVKVDNVAADQLAKPTEKKRGSLTKSFWNLVKNLENNATGTVEKVDCTGTKFCECKDCAPNFTR